ncbi:HalOD1 output domain-containing protein [Halobacterium litoreum]|uniref:HalOD1 output domain-containing protein n=1 Tax=Halobacterium litoreum TaxID=2039234 RepID=A0ABD5NIL0_9EURY|nr:HalOD1 output domain-containing protein [Halobacterium litoreum]UHH12171.1 hypothetical protein LT972_08380 [Halobacterium litoreum]
MTEHEQSNGGASDDNVQESAITPQMQVAQRHYNPVEDSDLTTTLVYALAEARDIDPTELKHPPLYEVVDVAGIEQALFKSHSHEQAEKAMGSVEFTYEEFRVTVSSDGWVQVYATSQS